MKRIDYAILVTFSIGTLVLGYDLYLIVTWNVDLDNHIPFLIPIVMGVMGTLLHTVDTYPYRIERPEDSFLNKKHLPEYPFKEGSYD